MKGTKGASQKRVEIVLSVFFFRCPVNWEAAFTSQVGSWSRVKQEPQTSHCQYKSPFRDTAQTDSTENWKEGGKGNSAVLTEPITSVCVNVD